MILGDLFRFARRFEHHCFAELGDRIAARGGDLIDFAGDAVLALWPAETEDGLSAAVVQAAACAFEIQTEMGALPAVDADVLRFYASVGAGQVTLLHAGGVRGRWKFVAAGSPITQVAHAMRHCDIGEVVVSPEAWRTLQGAGGVDAGDGFMRLTGMAGEHAAAPVRPIAAVAGE